MLGAESAMEDDFPGALRRGDWRRICRAAFPKPRSVHISMKRHRKFDWAAGFCEPRPSARLVL